MKKISATVNENGFILTVGSEWILKIAKEKRPLKIKTIEEFEYDRGIEKGQKDVRIEFETPTTPKYYFGRDFGNLFIPYEKSSFIISNKIQTPDGTVLESKTRHEFVRHLDANGKEYAVDGGRDYLRRVGLERKEFDGYIELSVTSENSHKEIRSNLTIDSANKSKITLEKASNNDVEIFSQSLMNQTKRITPYSRFLIKLMDRELLYRQLVKNV